MSARATVSPPNPLSNMPIGRSIGCRLTTATAAASSGEFDAYTRDCLIAFQMRYRPANFDGQPDAETAALLAAVTTPDKA